MLVEKERSRVGKQTRHDAGGGRGTGMGSMRVESLE